MPAADRILRCKDLPAIVGLSRSTVYELELRGKFPRRVALTGGRVGWRESDILAWVRSRPTIAPSRGRA